MSSSPGFVAHVKEEITNFASHTHRKVDIQDFAHTHNVTDLIAVDQVSGVSYTVGVSGGSLVLEPII